MRLGKVVSKEYIEQVLDGMTQSALKGKKVTPGRIATIQCLVDLGEGWHSYTEVQKRLQTYLVSGAIFTIQLAKQYPTIFEIDEEYKVRIRPELFRLVARLIKPRTELVMNEHKMRKDALKGG